MRGLTEYTCAGLMACVSGQPGWCWSCYQVDTWWAKEGLSHWKATVWHLWLLKWWWKVSHQQCLCNQF